MTQVQIYSKNYCPYCKAAKATLNEHGLKYQDFDVTHDKALELEMRARSGRNKVPQIYINGHHLGGNDDLQKAVKNGELIRLLALKTQVA